MSLYGALFAGVSGLKSQANKLGVISDNVSNVNTVGYKGGNGLFETLVTSSTTTAAYSPGGVLGGNRLLVSKQGLLQATDSATDIAISGNGFFVVNQSADGTGQVFYTRSGSFRADSTGNFRNASGFYLQAWPLDREGRLPGAAGNTTYTTSSANLNSLSVVNVQNLTGSAAATSSVSVGANLNASQSVFPGSAGTVVMDSLSTENYQIAAKDIIVPTDVNKISRGDKMVITTGNGLTFTYRYGGFTHSRSIADGTDSDSGLSLLSNPSGALPSNPFSFTAGSNVVTVTQADHGLADGAVVSLSGITNNMAGIPSSQFNGKFVVNVIDEDTYTIEVATAAADIADIPDNSISTTSLGSGNGTDVTLTLGASHGYTAGQTVTIAAATVVNGVTISGTRTIASVTSTTITFHSTTDTPPTLAAQAFSNPSGNTIRIQVGTTNNTWAVNDTITIAGAPEINGMDPNDTWTVTAIGSGYVEVNGAENSQTASDLTLAASAITFPADTSDPTLTVDVGTGNGANFTIGDSITLTAGTLNGIALSGTYTITNVSGDDIEFAVTGTSSGAGTFGAGTETIHQNTAGAATATQYKPTGGGTAGTIQIASGGGSAVTSVVRPFAGRILDATNAETRFLATTGTSGYTTDALKFKITTAATGTVTFTYTSASPDVRQKQFNNLNNLAASINEVTGLSARVVDGKLYVGATDANAAVTFSNGSVLGTEGPPVQAGLDWVRELGLKNIEIGTDRFSSMQGLYNLATTDSGISATIENPLGAATLDINVDDPLDTISFADSPTAAPLVALAGDTPFTTTSGSNRITVDHGAPTGNGFAVGDFVTLNAAALADTQTLGANPISVTTHASNSVVTVDISASGHTYVAGQLITISGAATVGGVNPNGTWTVASVLTSPSRVTFASGQAGTSTSGAGGSAVTASYGSFNGIELADFSGRFEIVEATSTGYSIDLASDAIATATGSTGLAGLVVTPHNNLGSLVGELGLAASLNSGTYSPQSTTNFGPAYSPTDAALNMASGSTASQFSRPIRIYDAQGGGHDLNIAFLKTNVNTWAIEIYAVPAADVSTSLPNGLVAYGNVVFNGDGTLRQVDGTLSQESTIVWTNGASTSGVTFNWGTAGPPASSTSTGTVGEADGLSQYNAAYKVSFANQNGAPVGELTGVSITELGVVVASYSNGQTQSLYKIPLADFANPDQLDSSTGNVFAQSADSGEFNLRQAGTSGVGKIAASSLEASNVELSSELTDMIIAQRSYQANAKVISTSDNMLEELNRIIQ